MRTTGTGREFAQAASEAGPSLAGIDNSFGDEKMPVILWLLGVPLVVVVLLMLLHVV